MWPQVYTVQCAARRVCKAKQNTNFTKSSSRQKDTTVMSTEQTSSEVTSLHKRRIPRQTWRYIPRKVCTWSTVAHGYLWWDYLLWITQQRRLPDTQATFRIFRLPMVLWSQTHERRSTSRNSALICGYIWWRILRQCHRWEDNAMRLTVVISDRQEKLPDYQKVRKSSNPTPKTSFPW